MRFLLILLIPFFLFAEVSYKPMTDLNMTSEGSLMRINKINNETFDFFKIYMDKETSKKLSTDCLVKHGGDYNTLSLSTGKPFKCGEEYIELINREVPAKYSPSVSDILYSEVELNIYPRAGMLITLSIFLITFIIYLIFNKPNILFGGIISGIIFGFIIGLANNQGWITLTKYNSPPYSKTYLIKYYDDIEDKEGYKVFRKGF